MTSVVALQRDFSAHIACARATDAQTAPVSPGLVRHHGTLRVTFGHVRCGHSDTLASAAKDRHRLRGIPAPPGLRTPGSRARRVRHGQIGVAHQFPDAANSCTLPPLVAAETTPSNLPPATGPRTRHTGYECDRAAARGVQTKDQDADRAAVRGHRCDAVLGATCLRPNHYAQGRWLADARHETD
jgi:hypothetical protein